jgi:hypothetical protein
LFLHWKWFQKIKKTPPFLPGPSLMARPSPLRPIRARAWPARPIGQPWPPPPSWAGVPRPARLYIGSRAPHARRALAPPCSRAPPPAGARTEPPPLVTDPVRWPLTCSSGRAPSISARGEHVFEIPSIPSFNSASQSRPWPLKSPAPPRASGHPAAGCLCPEEVDEAVRFAFRPLAFSVIFDLFHVS